MDRIPAGRRRWPKGTWMRLTSGTTLRALMDQHRYSNEDVARAAGVGRTFVSALVNGRRNSCKPSTAENIARCLKVPTEVLFVAQQSAGSRQNIRIKRSAA